MTTISLDVTLKKGGGAEDAWMVIDNQDVKLVNGRNSAFSVDAAVERHSYVVWVEGKPGAFATLSIKQDSKVVASGKPMVAAGNTSRVETGGFKHL